MTTLIKNYSSSEPSGFLVSNIRIFGLGVEI